VEQQRGGSSGVEIGDRLEGSDVTKDWEDGIGNEEWDEDGMVVSGVKDSGITTSEECVVDSGLWSSKRSVKLEEKSKEDISWIQDCDNGDFWITMVLEFDLWGKL